MAKKVTVTLIDDFDGKATADETVAFGLDGVTYEIDLSARNAAKLRAELQNWVKPARRVGGRRRAATPRVPRSGGDAISIRDWAHRNGYEVAARGRIRAEVISAYAEAHH